MARAIEEIATVPAAPPSRLSKKFIELHIPTTQITVIIESNICEPVGFPTLSPSINTAAVKRPATVWAINLGNGFRFLDHPKVQSNLRAVLAQARMLLAKRYLR